MDVNDHLRPQFTFWLSVVWTALGAIAVYFNGGLGQVKSPISLTLATAMCGATFAFFFGAIASERVRSIVLRPEVDISTARRGLVSVALVLFVLTLACVAGFWFGL
jgi:hypothetical protein